MSQSQIAAELHERGRALVAAYPEPAGALHPLLDLAFAAEGSWNNETAHWVAELTGMSVAVVNGIASTRQQRSGAADEVHVCVGLSCRWMGADAACERLATLPGIRVVTVDCLGACAAAPVMSRNGRLHDGLTPERLDALVAGDR